MNNQAVIDKIIHKYIPKENGPNNRPNKKKKNQTIF